MRILLIAAAIIAPSVAMAEPDRGWGLWIDRGGQTVALQDVRAEFSGPTLGQSPSIQAGYGWRRGAMAAVLGYHQPPGERALASPVANARYPGAPSAGAPGVMGLSFSLPLR